jgi:hypothetical protein
VGAALVSHRAERDLPGLQRAGQPRAAIPITPTPCVLTKMPDTGYHFLNPRISRFNVTEPDPGL